MFNINQETIRYKVQDCNNIKHSHMFLIRQSSRDNIANTVDPQLYSLALSNQLKNASKLSRPYYCLLLASILPYEVHELVNAEILPSTM